jgi:hypothetical protein
MFVAVGVLASLACLCLHTLDKNQYSSAAALHMAACIYGEQQSAFCYVNVENTALTCIAVAACYTTCYRPEAAARQRYRNGAAVSKLLMVASGGGAAGALPNNKAAAVNKVSVLLLTIYANIVYMQLS